MSRIDYQIDDFMEHCIEKGLARRTISSYEQSLVLFANYLKDNHKVEDATKVKRSMIREYIDYMRKRGKYTVVGNEKSRNFNYP